MSRETRVVHLQLELCKLEFKDSLRALNQMIEVMNAQNGYSRHDGSNYYLHLVDATQDLLNHGVRDQSTVTACILHDAIEDVDYMDKSFIVGCFGHEVANLVEGVTKIKGVNYKDEINMKAYLTDILLNPKLCLIKTADRKHNFSTLEFATPEKELRQAMETEKYFIPFFKEARQRYPEYSYYFHSAKTTIMPHLNKIKKYHKDIEILKQEIKLLKGEI